jgi:hypothetical protein
MPLPPALGSAAVVWHEDMEVSFRLR